MNGASLKCCSSIKVVEEAGCGFHQQVLANVSRTGEVRGPFELPVPPSSPLAHATTPPPNALIGNKPKHDNGND